MQQSYKNQPSFDQVEVLNASCENKEESLLNILLEEVLAMDAEDLTIVIDDEMNRVSGY